MHKHIYRGSKFTVGSVTIALRADEMRKEKSGQPLQSKLDVLSSEFDALLARMQTAKARKAMRAAFSASPEQLGKAAVAAARKQG